MSFSYRIVIHKQTFDFGGELKPTEFLPNKCLGTSLFEKKIKRIYYAIVALLCCDVYYIKI